MYFPMMAGEEKNTLSFCAWYSNDLVFGAVSVQSILFGRYPIDVCTVSPPHSDLSWEVCFCFGKDSLVPFFGCRCCALPSLLICLINAD